MALALKLNETLTMFNIEGNPGDDASIAVMQQALSVNATLIDFEGPCELPFIQQRTHAREKFLKSGMHFFFHLPCLALIQHHMLDCYAYGACVLCRGVCRIDQPQATHRARQVHHRQRLAQAPASARRRWPPPVVDTFY